MNGAPLSGEQVSESVQVLVDGTQITHKAPGPEKMYRDFAGRTRTERVLIPYPPVPSSGTSPRATPLDDIMAVEIYDPIVGFRYALDTLNHVAHRQKVRAFTPSPAAKFSTAPVTPPPAAMHRSESLGPQMINCVL